MISNFIKKLNNKLTRKLKEKKGASMAVVITSMSLLIILGTTFSTLAYNSYQHSFGNMCRQQATLTSKGVLDGFVEAFKAQSSLRQEVTLSLRTAVEAKMQTDPNIDPKTVAVKVKVSGLDSNMVDTNKANATNNCDILVSYYNDERSKLRVKSVAQYKGFKSSLSAILGFTNKASKELSKIMSNTLYFTSPIVDMMYYLDENNKPFINQGVTKPHANTDYAVVGDVYVDAPYWDYKKDENGELILDENGNPQYDEDKNPYTHVSALPTVDGATEEIKNGHTLEIDNQGRPNIVYDNNGIPKQAVPYEKIDGEFLRDINGNIVYEGINGFKLNNDATDYVYGNGYETVGVDNKHLTGEMVVKKDNLGKFLNFKASKEGTKFVEDIFNNSDLGCIQYDLFTGAQSDIPLFGETDVQGFPIFSLPTVKQGDPDIRTSINTNQLSETGGYYKYALQPVWYTGNNGDDKFWTYSNPKNDGNWFKLKYEDKKNSWYYVEVFETVDPKNPSDKIYVTGRIRANEKRNDDWVKHDYWRLDEKYSFRRVEMVGGNKQMVVLVDVDENFKRKGRYPWNNWTGVENEPYYNFYKYQRTRIKEKSEVPAEAYKPLTAPNTWTEVYLRGHYWGNIQFTLPLPLVIDGNLKCNTDVLLGLDNRGRGKGKDTFTSSHGFHDENGNWKEVSYDSLDNNYSIAQYNALTLTGDVYVNGNIKGENLIAGMVGSAKSNWTGIGVEKVTSKEKGNIYAIDNNPNDDNLPGGCKGNVFFQQAQYQSSILGISLSGYLDVNNIIADGYVFVGGCPADLSEKAFVRGNIYAGKYNPDGTIWGKRGKVLEDIPTNKFYFEDERVGVAPDILNDYPNTLPGGIYGYRTQAEVNAGRRSRYELGSGDVVIQQAYIEGDIYATGDVYLSNGVCVKGSIYTPGNVYITKGDNNIDTLRPNIASPTDPRCRVWGSIYAGGDVAITGGCEVGRFEAKSINDVGFNSSIHCGGNLYIRGRCAGRDHEVVPGDVYVGKNLNVVGQVSEKLTLDNFRFYTKIGYNAGNIYVKGDINAYKELNGDSPFILFGGVRKAVEDEVEVIPIYTADDTSWDKLKKAYKYPLLYKKGDITINTNDGSVTINLKDSNILKKDDNFVVIKGEEKYRIYHQNGYTADDENWNKIYKAYWFGSKFKEGVTVTIKDKGNVPYNINLDNTKITRDGEGYQIEVPLTDGKSKLYKIYKEGTIKAIYTPSKKSEGTLYCGGNFKLGSYCQILTGTKTYIEEDFELTGDWIYTDILIVGGKIKSGSEETWCYGDANYYAKDGYENEGNLKAKAGNINKYVGLPTGDIANKPNDINNWNGGNYDFDGKATNSHIESYNQWKKPIDLYQKAVSANIKKWSSPDDNVVYGDNINKSLSDFATNKNVSQNITTLNQDATTAAGTDQPKSPYNYIISESVKNLSGCTLQPSEKLLIDTTKKNIHIVLNSDLIMKPDSQIIVNGKNMAFIYLEGSAKKIEVGERAKLGISGNVSGNNSGLHIISMTKDAELNIQKDAEVYSSNYLPNGILSFNLDSSSLTGRDASIAKPNGSYAISRFKGETINAMYRWRIKFTHASSPLILDVNGEVDYGNTDTEIQDYKEIHWELLEYE